MNITISGRKTTIRDSFKERVEKKLSKLDRFFDQDATAQVTVTNERDRETVEVTVQYKGMYFRAEKTTQDRSESLDLVVDALIKQIVKNKNKLGQKLRSSAFDPVYHDEPVEAEEHELVKTKRFPVKPMTVEEAILQMNLLEHEFYMFRNSEDGEINVVYKRKDGNYGLIEPLK